MSTEQPTASPDSAAPLQPAPKAELHARRPLTFWAPLVLAGLAVAFSALLWEKLSRIQGQLARQSADAGQQSLEAKAWAKQAQAVSYTHLTLPTICSA